MKSLPHEHRRPPASGTEHRRGHGRYRRLLRRHLPLFQRHLHHLLKRKTHLDEPVQDYGHRVCPELRREEELPQVAHLSHLQRQRGTHEDRGQDHQPDHRRVLRVLLHPLQGVYRRRARPAPQASALRGQEERHVRETQ